MVKKVSVPKLRVGRPEALELLDTEIRLREYSARVAQSLRNERLRRLNQVTADGLRFVRNEGSSLANDEDVLFTVAVSASKNRMSRQEQRSVMEKIIEITKRVNTQAAGTAKQSVRRT